MAAPQEKLTRDTLRTLLPRPPVVILLPTASSDTPHGNHPIDAQEHHSSSKRCSAQERLPSMASVFIAARILCGSTEACAPERQKAPGYQSGTRMPMQSTTGAKCRKDAVGAHAGLSPDNSEDHLDQGNIWNVRGTLNDVISFSAPRRTRTAQHQSRQSMAPPDPWRHPSRR